MMQPRSVTMGNKIYRINVKYGSTKDIVDATPDTNIIQLTKKIEKITGLPPNQQKWLCNGKPFEKDVNMTLKQANIINGSKILVTSCKATDDDLSIYEEGDIEHSEEKKADGVLNQIDEIEGKGQRLEQSMDMLSKQRKDIKGCSSKMRGAEYKRLKKECGKINEDFMKLLESLDSISLSEDQQEARTRRKNLANFLNRMLDKNDGILHKLDSSLGRIDGSKGTL